MVRDEFHDEDKIQEMMSFSFPFEHDNFAKPEEYPYYFRLIDGWTVEKKSLQFLTDGPLFSENSKKVLVHSRVFVKPFLHRVWRFIVAFAVLLGLFSSIINIIGKLS